MCVGVDVVCVLLLCCALHFCSAAFHHFKVKAIFVYEPRAIAWCQHIFVRSATRCRVANICPFVVVVVLSLSCAVAAGLVYYIQRRLGRMVFRLMNNCMHDDGNGQQHAYRTTYTRLFTMAGQLAPGLGQTAAACHHRIKLCAADDVVLYSITSNGYNIYPIRIYYLYYLL